MASDAHWSLKAVKLGRTMALIGAASATFAAMITQRDVGGTTSRIDAGAGGANVTAVAERVSLTD